MNTTTETTKPIPPQLNDGEIYLGALTGTDGRRVHVILMAGDIRNCTWNEAKQWAKSSGGALPNQKEFEILSDICSHRLKNPALAGEFEVGRYWSSDEHALHSDCAHVQDIRGCSWSTNKKTDKLHARAVRRVEV